MKSPGVELSAAKLKGLWLNPHLGFWFLYGLMLPTIVQLPLLPNNLKLWLKENIFQGYWVLVGNCYLAILPLWVFFFFAICKLWKLWEKEEKNQRVSGPPRTAVISTVWLNTTLLSSRINLVQINTNTSNFILQLCWWPSSGEGNP